MSLLAHAGAAALTVALVSLATAAEAYAQAPPPTSGSSAKVAASGPPALWRFGVNADATWYENAQFVGGSQAPSAWSTHGTASLGYTRRFSSGAFGIGAQGGALYYPEIDGYSQPTWGSNLSLNLAPSPRTQFHLGQFYTRTNTRQLAFDPGGPASADERASTTLTSTAGLTHQLSRSWQLGLDGSFGLRHYADSRLVDGEDLSASAQLGRQVGQSSAVYMNYGFMDSWYASTSNRSHQVLLGARRQPARGVGLEAAAGVAYLETAGQLYPAGNASLNAHGRRTSFSLAYRRDFGQAFGYGRQTVGDLGSASLGWTPATKVNFSVGYSYGYRRDAADVEYKIRTQVASGRFTWDITKDLGLTTGYAWEKNVTEGLAAVEGSRVMAALSYGVEWR